MEKVKIIVLTIKHLILESSVMDLIVGNILKDTHAFVLFYRRRNPNHEMVSYSLLPLTKPRAEEKTVTQPPTPPHHPPCCPTFQSMLSPCFLLNCSTFIIKSLIFSCNCLNQYSSDKHAYTSVVSNATIHDNSAS